MLAFLTVGVAASSARARASRYRCVVPNVKRDSLGAAEKRLRAAHCSAGVISGPRSGIVNVQRPKAGRRGRLGARVALTMRRRPSAKRASGKPLVTVPATPEPVGISGNWKLVLDSEFTGNSLNTSIWRVGWFGNGMTSPMTSTQEDCYSPSNVTFPGDGTMHLSVTSSPSTCGGVSYPYTGALVSTNPAEFRAGGGFQYTYGALEVRAYVPPDGTLLADWPGVWADGQSWPADGEDDLMEGLFGQACATFHNLLGVTRLCDKTLAPGWHTFASDWEPGSITYYYDGVSIGTVTTGVTSDPMFIILDNTVHTNEANVTEPAVMQVQYVRVWQSQS